MNEEAVTDQSLVQLAAAAASPSQEFAARLERAAAPRFCPVCGQGLFPTGRPIHPSLNCARCVRVAAAGDTAIHNPGTPPWRVRRGPLDPFNGDAGGTF